MSWALLSDDLPLHPVLADCSSDAFRLYVSGFCAAQSRGSGLLVDRPCFAIAAIGVKRPPAALRELLAAQLWREVKAGWEIDPSGPIRPPSPARREAARRAGERSGAVRRERSPNGAFNAELNETGTERSTPGSGSVEPVRAHAGGNPVSVIQSPCTPLTPPHEEGSAFGNRPFALDPDVIAVLQAFPALLGRNHTQVEAGQVADALATYDTLSPEAMVARMRGFNEWCAEQGMGTPHHFGGYLTALRREHDHRRDQNVSPVVRSTTGRTDGLTSMASVLAGLPALTRRSA